MKNNAGNIRHTQRTTPCIQSRLLSCGVQTLPEFVAQAWCFRFDPSQGSYRFAQVMERLPPADSADPISDNGIL
jgi:hypothetical protein